MPDTKALALTRGVNSRNLAHLALWARRAVLTGGAQAAVQLLGFLAGIIVIRSVTPEQYAYYTIANAALGVMTVLTDSGVSNAVMAQAGQVWQDRMRFGAVIASGLALRRTLALIILPLALPVTALLLRNQGASWIESALLATAILPALVSTLSGQLLEVAPRLHQRLLELQRIQIGTNLGRVGLVALLLLQWPLAFAALIATALPQWWANWRLRRLADAHADWHVPADAHTRGLLLAQVRRTMPSALYYALSGQLTVWLASLFGATSSVAAVGALGRLAMILNVLGVAFTLLVVPRFARIPAADGALARRRYWQSQALFAFTCAVPVACLAMFPTQALAILGPHYSGLAPEAVLMAASSVAAMMSGHAYVLGASRGFVASPLLVVPYCLAGQVLLMSVLPLDSISGVIWIALASAASQWLLHTVYFLRASSRKTVTTAS